jgi:hypothetical protein
MATWNYSGDPSTSNLDKYRFLIGDTLEDDQVLQDAEINFIINNYSNQNMILYQLFSACANFFARYFKNGLGDASEDPTSRLDFYQTKAMDYQRKVASGLSFPKHDRTIFHKDMFEDKTTVLPRERLEDEL